MNDFIPKEGNLVDRVESGFSVTEKYNEVVDESETKFKSTENYQDPVRHILSSYDLGQKLRQLRLRMPRSGKKGAARLACCAMQCSSPLAKRGSKENFA